MDNALSYVLQFGLTKSQIDFFASKALAEINTGMYNPLEIQLCLKSMEELLKRLKEGIAEQVLTEAEKYGKSFEYMGAKIQMSERRTFDFSNDATWFGLNNAIKQREDMLKHITSSVADAETGEMIFPPQVKITPIISIALAK